MNLRAQDIVARLAAGRDDARRPPVVWRPGIAVLRMRFVVWLLLIDVAGILLPLWLAILLRGARTPDNQWLVTAAALLPTYLVIAWNSLAYSTALSRSPARLVSSALRSFAIAVGVLVMVAFWLKADARFSRLALATGVAGGTVMLGLGRYAFARRIGAVLGGDPLNSVLIRDTTRPVPTGDCSIVISAEGYFDPDRHDPEMYDRLARTLKLADRVIVACEPARRASWASALKGANVQGEILVPELEHVAPMGFATHDGMPTAIIARGPLRLNDRIVKRTFDLAIAGVAVVVLAPLLLAIALVIRLESPGPVFFVQTRIGQGNAMFRMLKFRSMRHEESDGDGHRSTARDDDRITRFGGLLRRTSLDELPQILNVLAGDMSIVGPRPHAIGSRAADKLFWEIDERYWHRHAAKPGLTGLAQVRGYRGATLEEIDLLQRLQSDLEYLSDWSIWSDVRIIVRTFGVLLHRNAY